MSIAYRALESRCGVPDRRTIRSIAPVSDLDGDHIADCFAGSDDALFMLFPATLSE